MLVYWGRRKNWHFLKITCLVRYKKATPHISCSCVKYYSSCFLSLGHGRRSFTECHWEDHHGHLRDKGCRRQWSPWCGNCVGGCDSASGPWQRGFCNINVFGLMYALNLQYPTKLRFTFEILQKLIMELDGGELSVKAQNFKSKLHQWDGPLFEWLLRLNDQPQKNSSSLHARHHCRVQTVISSLFRLFPFAFSCFLYLLVWISPFFGLAQKLIDWRTEYLTHEWSSINKRHSWYVYVCQHYFYLHFCY